MKIFKVLLAEAPVGSLSTFWLKAKSADEIQRNIPCEFLGVISEAPDRKIADGTVTDKDDYKDADRIIGAMCMVYITFNDVLRYRAAKQAGSKVPLYSPQIQSALNWLA